MTVPELKAKLDQYQHILSQFTAENPVNRELKQLQREIYEHFKYTGFADDAEKEQLQQDFAAKQLAFKERQDQINAENESFAETTNAEIEKLGKILEEELVEKGTNKDFFTGTRKLVNDILAKFRMNRFPSRESKDKSWETFNTYRDRLKKAEDAYYENIRAEKEKQSERSAELAEKIIPAIETCHPEVQEENMNDRVSKFKDYTTSLELKISAFDVISENGNGTEKKSKNPLLLKSETLRALRKFINENRDLISKEDKNKIHFVVEEVQADLDKAWTVYKEELQKKREEWEVKKKENDGKRKEWEQKQKEFLGKLEDRYANQASFKEKLEAIYHKQIGFQEKLEKRLIDQLAFIGKLNVQLDGLDEKYESARTDQFRETVTEWINEKKSKIADVEDDVADLEDKLKDVKRRTDELSDKIREVETSKEEIRSKIEEVKKKLGRITTADKPAA